MKLDKIILSLLMALLLTGCKDLIQGHRKQQENNKIDIIDVDFDEDYKYFHADVELKSPVSALFLHNDSSVIFKAVEYAGGKEFSEETQPRLLDVKNVRAEELKNLNVNILALADLTLDEELVRLQHIIIHDMKNLLSEDQVNVAFLKDRSVTETMHASEYVLDNYFKSLKGEKYFYRGFLSKLDEQLDNQRNTPLMYNADTAESFLKARTNMLLILSDGKVYGENNQPIDPNHFAIQQKLAARADELGNVPILYINLTPLEGSGHPQEDSDNLLRLMCEKSGGKYVDYEGSDFLLKHILEMLNERFADFRFYFENPDDKIYRGMYYTLQIGCYSNDTLLASDNVHYSIGSLYNPIIVNGESNTRVIMRGAFFGLLALFIIYVLMQFVLPAINYLLFRKKYLTYYTGKNMSFNNQIIPSVCYYCKAPFEIGDRIVARCQHVMHKSCWDENGYHCPEYGQNCRHGSHYYNRNNLFDTRNASFYMFWIIAGALAGLAAWISYTSMAHHAGGRFFAMTIPWLFDIEMDTASSSMLIQEYGSHIFYLPFYGLNIGFFLTFTLSILSGHGRWLWKRAGVLLGKSIFGSVAGCLSFYIEGIISIAFDITDSSFLIDWIPWMLSGLAIAVAVSYGTDIKLKKALIGAGVSIFFGLGSMYLWTYSFDSQYDTREFMLLSYLIYSIGFAISIAYNSPKSQHYFLRVEGPIKVTDIALYKWMNANQLNRRVCIGKSVNCELQMTWDINSEISPEQAEIRMQNGNVFLVPLEKGVWMNHRQLEAENRIQLYHGSKFVIGKTTFTYLEKDM